MKPKKGVVPAHLRKYLFKKKTGGQNPMAKRRLYTKVKRAARRVYASARRGVRRSYRASKTAGMSLIDIGFSFGYGYARSFITNNEMFQKGLSMIPFGGDFKDNILLGGAAYVINWLWKPSHHLVKLALRTIVNSEAFLAGAKLRMGASVTTPAITASQTAGDYL